MHSHQRPHQTLEQRLGFQDSDRKNGKHDELALWTWNNAQHCVETALRSFAPDWPLNIVRRHLERFVDHRDRAELLLGELREWLAEVPVNRRVVGVDVESPIAKGNYIVGFSDVSVRWEATTLTLGSRLFSDSIAEAVLDRRPQQLLRRSRQLFTTHFEVKTAVQAFGDLLRQINLYRACCDPITDTFAVVTPDTRFREILTSQAVGLVVPE